jgi:hypothetical protein
MYNLIVFLLINLHLFDGDTLAFSYLLELFVIMSFHMFYLFFQFFRHLDLIVEFLFENLLLFME